MFKKLLIGAALVAATSFAPAMAATSLPEGSRLVFGAVSGANLTNATVLLPDGSYLAGVSMQDVSVQGASVSPEGLMTGGEITSGKVVAIANDAARGVGSAELVGASFAIGGATVSVLAVVGTIVTIAIVREGIRTTTTHGS
jgi:hypothetical protein